MKYHQSFEYDKFIINPKSSDNECTGAQLGICGIVPIFLFADEQKFVMFKY